MLARFIKINFILLFFSSYVYAETLNSFNIEGNKRISDETIVVFSKVKIGQNISESDLNAIVINLFETDFFKDVSIKFNKNILDITVVENPVIQTLTIEGIKKKNLKEKIKEVITLKDRSSYKELFAKKDVNIILNALRSIGYYFAEIDYIVKYNDNNIVLLKLY